LPNADGTIESPSPEGNPLTQVAEHHIPLNLSLTGNLISSHNYFSRSELWIRIHLNPDPAFQVNPDRDPDLIRIQGFDDQKLKKKNTAKIYFLSFLIKNRYLLMSRLQETHSALKREHPALLKMKFIDFFLSLWILFALLDPDPIRIRFGFTAMLKMISNTA
jgi:hypothetical protein